MALSRALIGVGIPVMAARQEGHVGAALFFLNTHHNRIPVNQPHPVIDALLAESANHQNS
jgi:hypothetical protein